MKNTEILIVGATPAGLSLALALDHYDVKCRIIDANSGPATTFKAVFVDARTLEVWDAMGFVEPIVAAGQKIKEIKLYSENKPLNHTTFSGIESKFNFLLTLPQAQIEQLLLEQLKQRNINVEWNTSVDSMQDVENTVNLICNHQGQTQEISAKWVIGCDGYNSQVRDLGQFDYQCYSLAQKFLVVDAQIEGNLSNDKISLVFSSKGALLFTPLKKIFRVFIEISNDSQFCNAEQITPNELSSIIKDRFKRELKIISIMWQSNFKLHECLADKFKKGRILLAGDAAHSHSPGDGQGLNTGIQDAWGLSWMLAHVVKNQADKELIEFYNNERRGIANNVLKRSGSLNKIANTNNKFLQLLRNFGVGGILNIEIVRNKIANSLAQTDICYMNSPLINSNQVVYQNKNRYTENNGKWLLLSKDAITESDLPKFVTIEQNPINWSDQALCLIRPDGYIAMYADSLFEVTSYFIENNIHD
jgi:2-polyprenyl-6-methoxyphenol hydroxylase-like FAD-dependent oxidoreductase